jgi:hypothetical protein
MDKILPLLLEFTWKHTTPYKLNLLFNLLHDKEKEIYCTFMYDFQPFKFDKNSNIFRKQDKSRKKITYKNMLNFFL